MRRRRVVIGLLVVLLVAVGALVFSAGKIPVLHVVVVNEAGAPVPGVTIQPDGIRGTDRAHYWWGDHMSVKPLPVTTDAKGKAKIPYPRFIVERVRSIELSFGVDHPEYSPDRPFVQVASPMVSTTPFLQRLRFIYDDFRQSGTAERIVLRPGAVIELTARIESRAIAATNFYAQLVPADGVFDGRFVRAGDRLISKKVPPGDFMVRACARVDGTTYFSEPLMLRGARGETNIVNVELKRGHVVEGRLSGVDAQIKDGWVNARVVITNANELMFWADFAEVRPDGSFQLSGLPAGRLECVAVCEGYLSEKPGTNFSPMVLPHCFDIPASAPIEIPMRRSAVASVRATGPSGEPVTGAVVGFWPNVRWGEWSSTIFASDFYREIDALERNERLGWQERRAKRSYTAKTDEDGRAVVRELPPETLEYSVEHPGFELSLNGGRRNISMRLVGGETNFTGAKLERKGREMRE